MNGRRAWAVGVLAMLVGVVVPASPASADVVTRVGGGAFGVWAAITPASIAVVPIPSVVLAPGGGQQTSSLVTDFDLPGVASLHTAQVSTHGSPGETLTPCTEPVCKISDPPHVFAASSVELGHVSIDPLRLRFEAIHAQCQWDGSGAYGSATFANASKVPVNFAPNTIESIPGVAKVIFNEQFFEQFDGQKVIVVNAIHAWLYNVAGQTIEAIIGQASCDPNPYGQLVQDTNEGGCTPQALLAILCKTTGK